MTVLAMTLLAHNLQNSDFPVRQALLPIPLSSDEVSCIDFLACSERIKVFFFPDRCSWMKPDTMREHKVNGIIFYLTKGIANVNLENSGVLFVPVFRG